MYIAVSAHAAVPDFGAGAMENWGLAIYREALLLYESGTTSVNDQIYIVIVLAHEISHMVGSAHNYGQYFALI